VKAVTDPTALLLLPDMARSTEAARTNLPLVVVFIVDVVVVAVVVLALVVTASLLLLFCCAIVILCLIFDFSLFFL